MVGLADTAFTYGARDDAFITSMEMNVFHFSAAKTLAELQELNSLFRESGSFEEFHKKALQTTDVFNKRWQQTEYETAVLTAESASNYQRLVGKTKLFPYWEYKTAGDDKVREEHRKLDGLSFRPMIRGGTRYSRRTGGNVDATLSPLWDMR